MSHHRFVVRWVAALALFGVASAALAECGGQQECMAVSIDPAVPPAHGTPEITAPLLFGSQDVGSEGAAKVILVGAVTGPAGSLATLTRLDVTGTHAGDFRIVSSTCTVGGPSLLADGPTCSVNVAFKPATLGARNAVLQVSTSAITRTIPLTGTGTVPLPTATAATLTVRAQASASLDLADRIGPANQSLTLAISTPPQNGAVVLAGTVATYTPRADFIGADAFAYTVTGEGGTSSPATVTVSVVPRSDPSADAVVQGVLRAQSQTAQRFASAQMANVQSRLGSLRRGPPGRSQSSKPPRSAAASVRPGAKGPAQQVLVADRSSEAEATAALSGDLPVREGVVPPAWFLPLAQLAQTGSITLDGAQASASRQDGAGGFWVGGQSHFGSRRAGNNPDGLRFRSDGLTVGLDRRFTDSLLLGASAGYAKDRSDIGSDGSATRAEGRAFSLYASFQPDGRWFLEGMVGWGRVGFDIDRFVAADAVMARGHRDGRQRFGSLSVGREIVSGRVTWAPYGRIDASHTRLESYAETGAGLSALTFQRQTVPSVQAALGVEAQSRHSADFGWVMPRLRLERRQELRREGTASMFYNGVPGTVYAIAPRQDRRDSWSLGLGSDFFLGSGLTLGVDFQTIRLAATADRDQTVRVWLSKPMNSAPMPPPTAAGESWFDDPVRIEAALTFDDNLNRAGEASQERFDRLYSLSVAKTAELRLAPHFRLVATAFGSADKFMSYAALDRASFGGLARIEYRASPAFTAPLLGVQTRMSVDNPSDALREGRQASLALTYRQSLTDRIELFGTSGAQRRYADGDPFDLNDRFFGVQFDYALSPTSTLYLAGERRRGGAVSTVPQSPAYESFATAFAADTAYRTAGLVAYRYDARTTLWTLGFNRPLGPRDGIDLSVRRIASTPTAPATVLYGSPPSYATTQYSLAYLMRF